jgi:hypothetical protein
MPMVDPISFERLLRRPMPDWLRTGAFFSTFATAHKSFIDRGLDDRARMTHFTFQKNQIRIT